MGIKSREIVGLDIKALIETLNKAFADEWLAHYQYWLGAKIVAGPMKSTVAAELVQHAADEVRHADMVAERIIQLGGTPILSPQEWSSIANCAYTAPQDPFVKVILEQNVEGERCAINVYNQILTMTRDKDPVTYNLALQILEDEIEHEEDLENFLEDLKLGNL